MHIEPGTLVSIILGILLGLSEALDAIPQIRASSIWKSIRNFIYSVGGKTIPPERPTDPMTGKTLPKDDEK